MLSGRFPGQEEALRQRMEELAERKDSRSTRRMFLGLAIGGALGACAGGGVGYAAATRPPPSTLPADSVASGALSASDEWLAELALGPKAELLRRHVDFLVAAGRLMPKDSRVWVGVARIAVALLEEDPALSRGTRAALLALERRPGFPEHMRGWTQMVRAQSR